MSPRGQERRRHARYQHRLGLRVSGTDAPIPPLPAPLPGAASHPIEIETLDISSGGAVCHSGILLPVMTRLSINLLLPSDDGRDASLLRPLLLRGCVVRAEPEPASTGRGGFRIALLFTEVGDDDQKALDRFLSGRYPERLRTH
jgi:hypothetical protein